MRASGAAQSTSRWRRATPVVGRPPFAAHWSGVERGSEGVVVAVAVVAGVRPAVEAIAGPAGDEVEVEVGDGLLGGGAARVEDVHSGVAGVGEAAGERTRVVGDGVEGVGVDVVE